MLVDTLARFKHITRKLISYGSYTKLSRILKTNLNSPLCQFEFEITHIFDLILLNYKHVIVKKKKMLNCNIKYFLCKIRKKIY